MADLIEIKTARFHNALFIGGKNHSDKIDLSERNNDNIRMQYDRDNRELLFHYNGEMAIIPTTNVSSMIAGQAAGKLETAFPPKVPQRPSAQVNSPQSHVFAGPGGGKTGK